MGEINKGPLDLVRDIAADAEELDLLARNRLSEHPEMVDDFERQVHDFDHVHPLIGQEVIIYGVAPLTVSIDREEAVPYSLAPPGSQGVLRGIYNGMTVRNVYDPATGSSTPRVLHMVYMGSDKAVLDAYGNMQQTHHYDYAPVQGSEVAPVHPLNAHSMADLANDIVAQQIDHMVFGDQDKPHVILPKLGLVINKMLRKLEWEPNDLNQQRASYINSLDLLGGVKMVTRDFVIGNMQEDPSGELLGVPQVDEDYHICPDMFEVAPGYDRLTVAGMPLFGGPPELYVRVNLEAGEVIMAPLKSVVDVQLIEAVTTSS